jgi:hypothetical protein
MKLLMSVGAVSIFTSSLIAACGGSSNNPPPANTTDSGTTTEDSGTQSVVDSGAPSEDSGTGFDAAAFTCMLTSGCATGQTCCITQAGSSCIAMGSACSMGLALNCTNTGECTGSQVCCGGLSGTGIASSCQAGPCPGSDQELCTLSSQCPTGQVCAPLMIFGMTVPDVESCQAGPSDAGGPDEGPPDTGATDASDASGD